MHAVTFLIFIYENSYFKSVYSVMHSAIKEGEVSMIIFMKKEYSKLRQSDMLT